MSRIVGTGTGTSVCIADGPMDKNQDQSYNTALTACLIVGFSMLLFATHRRCPIWCKNLDQAVDLGVLPQRVSEASRSLGHVGRMHGKCPATVFAECRDAERCSVHD